MDLSEGVEPSTNCAPLGGFDKTLRATCASGPEPLVRPAPTDSEEIAFVVEAATWLHQSESVPFEE